MPTSYNGYIVNKNNRVYGSIPVEFVFVDEAVPHAAADGHDFTRAHQLSHALIKSKVIDSFDKFLCLTKQLKDILQSSF